MAYRYLRKYNAAATINFALVDADGIDFQVGAVHATGDTKIDKDEAGEGNTNSGFTDNGQGYSLALTATEMQCARAVIYVVDQTATKQWSDDILIVETYGNASATHAVDFDDAVRMGLTALPNANADAAFGLPISDAGGLDLDSLDATVDAIETDTQDIQSRLPAALVGGRMDSDVEAINNDTTAADNLAKSTVGIVTGAAIAGTLSTTQMSTDLTEATDDHYNGVKIWWTSGALDGQDSDVTDYNGTTKVLTFTQVTEAPGAGDTFVLVI